MLREDLPSMHAESEREIHVEAPAVGEDEAHHGNDLFDDVWGSSPNSPILNGDRGDELVADRASTSEVSDIPRLRSRHVTEGYREGIAWSKEKFIQEGFDEGYSLGAELGLKAGWCLGVLEGVCKALDMVQTSGGKHPQGEMESEQRPKELFKKAQDELQMQKLFDPAYFGSDGIWLYDVPGSEDETTFKQVAMAHPVLSLWISTTRAAADRVGLAIE
jgi:flagellar biosynthesis/type III secretory pathway protein FliH